MFLLFADDKVLLASLNNDLQLTLGRLAAECEVAGMRCNSCKLETMVLRWKRMDCPLRFGIWELLGVPLEELVEVAG